MTKIIAITGGIGAGKSTFSKEILKRGFKLLDSDKQVSEIYKNPTKKFTNYLKKINLSKAVQTKQINKKYISEQIFTNTKIKKKLENYIFKVVRNKRDTFIRNEKRKKTKIIFLDIPLLFENNLHKNVNKVVCIISTKKERYKRLKKSKKMTKNLFNKIIRSQTTDVERKNKSDIIIVNNSTMTKYLEKIDDVLKNLIK